MRRNCVTRCALSQNAQKFCYKMRVVTKCAEILLQNACAVTQCTVVTKCALTWTLVLLFIYHEFQDMDQPYVTKVITSYPCTLEQIFWVQLCMEKVQLIQANQIKLIRILTQQYLRTRKLSLMQVMSFCQVKQTHEGIKAKS